LISAQIEQARTKSTPINASAMPPAYYYYTETSIPFEAFADLDDHLQHLLLADQHISQRHSALSCHYWCRSGDRKTNHNRHHK
jgi:hypothetical protein